MKTALITGASRGIGKAISIMLANDHYNLHLVCKNNIEELCNLKCSLEEKYGIKVNTYQGDVGDSTFVNHLFENISSLDLLINNAGISYVGLITDMTDNDWHETISTNLDSVFYFSRNATRIMLSQKSGKIINISSVWGNCGASMEVAYSASKGAVNAFTKALAKELAPSNIQVNAIACGLIDTDMNSHLSKEDLDDLVASIPADRIGTPLDVAKTVLSLVNTSDYLTGQIITLDGGWI